MHALSAGLLPEEGRLMIGEPKLEYRDKQRYVCNPHTSTHSFREIPWSIMG